MPADARVGGNTFTLPVSRPVVDHQPKFQVTTNYKTVRVYGSRMASSIEQTT